MCSLFSSSSLFSFFDIVKQSMVLVFLCFIVLCIFFLLHLLHSIHGFSDDLELLFVPLWQA